MYSGGFIFSDHSNIHIYVFHQVSFYTVETIIARIVFERDPHKYGIEVKTYHTYNGIFNAGEFMK